MSRWTIGHRRGTGGSLGGASGTGGGFGHERESFATPDPISQEVQMLLGPERQYDERLNTAMGKAALRLTNAQMALRAVRESVVPHKESSTFQSILLKETGQTEMVVLEKRFQLATEDAMLTSDQLMLSAMAGQLARSLNVEKLTEVPLDKVSQTLPEGSLAREYYVAAHVAETQVKDLGVLLDELEDQILDRPDGEKVLEKVLSRFEKVMGIYPSTTADYYARKRDVSRKAMYFADQDGGIGLREGSARLLLAAEVANDASDAINQQESKRVRTAGEFTRIIKQNREEAEEANVLIAGTNINAGAAVNHETTRVLTQANGGKYEDAFSVNLVSFDRRKTLDFADAILDAVRTLSPDEFRLQKLNDTDLNTREGILEDRDFAKTPRFGQGTLMQIDAKPLVGALENAQVAIEQVVKAVMFPPESGKVTVLGQEVPISLAVKTLTTVAREYAGEEGKEMGDLELVEKLSELIGNAASSLEISDTTKTALDIMGLYYVKGGIPADAFQTITADSLRQVLIDVPHVERGFALWQKRYAARDYEIDLGQQQGLGYDGLVDPINPTKPLHVLIHVKEGAELSSLLKSLKQPDTKAHVNDLLQDGNPRVIWVEKGDNASTMTAEYYKPGEKIPFFMGK